MSHYVPGTVLDPGNRAGNLTHDTSALTELSSGRVVKAMKKNYAGRGDQEWGWGVSYFTQGGQGRSLLSQREEQQC